MEINSLDYTYRLCGKDSVALDFINWIETGLITGLVSNSE